MAFGLWFGSNWNDHRIGNLHVFKKNHGLETLVPLQQMCRIAHRTFLLVPLFFPYWSLCYFTRGHLLRWGNSSMP